MGSKSGLLGSNMKFSTLEFKCEETIGLLTINRSQALNALNSQMLSELQNVIKQINGEKDLRCLIITGAGEKAFVAGADIKEMDEVDSTKALHFSEEGQRTFQMIEDLKIPTIAAVNGFALGGGLELAMSCDFIVAAKTAKLGLPEVSLGLIPGYGGTQRLARYCGKGVARLVTFTGDMYSAEQCANWGLVSLVVEPTDLLSTVMKMATTISKRSPRAVGLAKQAINRGFELTQLEGMKIEAQCFSEAFNSADKKEGVSAFIDKRAPTFRG